MFIWWLLMMTFPPDHTVICVLPVNLCLCVLVPVAAAKRPQKPRRLKNHARRNASVSFFVLIPHASTIHSLWKEKKSLMKKCNSLQVYSLTFLKLFFFFFMHRVVIEIHARGNLSDSRNCMIVFRSLLPSLHSVMSVIILFNFIASLTQLFI